MSETLRMKKSERLHDPFITAGDRTYLIGTQDGRFPDMGWHVDGEMGGLWTHPIKLLDGFWLAVDGAWLPPASSFTTGSFWAEHEHRVDPTLGVTRRQFVPPGHPAILVRYTLHASESRRVTLRFLARTDFQDVWPQVDEGPTHRADTATYLPAQNAWLCIDGANPWCAVIGSTSHHPIRREGGQDLWGPERTRGHGISVALDYELELDAGEDAVLDLAIAGSSRSVDEALHTFSMIGSWTAHWERQRMRYEALAARSRLDAPDPSLSRAWDWVKCTYDWLVRDVPGVGRGLGAGVDDYPWWFGCDNAYALLGCLALGQHNLATDTLDLLRTLSARANDDSGRVIHEANTRGFATNRGRTQETPHFVQTVWETFRWTGDLAFLHRNYAFCRKALLEWTLGNETAPGELFPTGEGIIELMFMDRQCIDTAVHTVRALAALAEMAEVEGDGAVAAECRQRDEQMRVRLEEDFWMEQEGLYGDMLATPEEMVPRLEQWLALARQPSVPGEDTARVLAEIEAMAQAASSDPEPGRKRPWLLKNWIVISPLEGELAEPERAMRVLDRVETPEFTGPWGMYLSGVHRGQMMSINTGVLAGAEIAYGRPEEGLRYVRMLTDTLEMRMPGAISEMSPDYGCFVQAWSGYAVVWPVVRYIFGLRPDAHRRYLELRPAFPASWPGAALRDVRIGGMSFDFEWDGEHMTVTAPDRSWTVTSPTVPLYVQYGDERVIATAAGAAPAE